MYYFIVLLRILAAPLIFILPLQSIILSVFLDLFDAEFAHKVVSKKKYELIDKNIDLWFYINIMIYSYLNYPDYKVSLFILFIYRFIGQVIYYLGKNRRILLFFPNFFEGMFILIFLGKNYHPSIITGQTFYLILFIIFIIKIFQEWFLHIADLSIREDFLKIKKRSWRK